MAHFARIDENNIVQQVIVVNNDVLLQDGIEVEQLGVDFCRNLLGGNWLQTSYNGNFRKNYAGIGFVYDENRDAFIPPKPFASWVLNEETCKWEAPIPKPHLLTYWDEDSQTWIDIQE